nr:gliding motility lipoprotein GldH [uncultured Draconibacterium sp.]
MSRFFQVILFAGIVMLLAACNSQSVFDKYKPIDKGVWNKDSLVVFKVPVTDTLQNHNLYINVRNNVDYRYSNLWLFVNIKQPSGEAVQDTFEMLLADPSGKWLGEGFGGLKTREAIYWRNVFFPHSGDYTISLQQGMRNDELKGISDVGVRVEKIK